MRGGFGERCRDERVGILESLALGVIGAKRWELLQCFVTTYCSCDERGKCEYTTDFAKGERLEDWAVKIEYKHFLELTTTGSDRLIGGRPYGCW